MGWVEEKSSNRQTREKALIASRKINMCNARKFEGPNISEGMEHTVLVREREVGALKKKVLDRLQMIFNRFPSNFKQGSNKIRFVFWGRQYLKEVKVQINIVASRNSKAKRLLEHSR